MVVELHLFVVIIRLEVAVDSFGPCSPCACHRPCLYSLRSIVVAAEALAVHIVVVVLTVVGDVKGTIIILDCLQLLTIF